MNKESLEARVSMLEKEVKSLYHERNAHFSCLETQELKKELLVLFVKELRFRNEINDVANKADLFSVILAIWLTILTGFIIFEFVSI
jgi:hypothetical protein